MLISLKGPWAEFLRPAQLFETASTESSFASQRYGRCVYSYACIFQTSWRRLATVGTVCCSEYILS